VNLHVCENGTSTWPVAVLAVGMELMGKVPRGVEPHLVESSWVLPSSAGTGLPRGDLNGACLEGLDSVYLLYGAGLFGAETLTEQWLNLW
jgi:hypothetical protein